MPSFQSIAVGLMALGGLIALLNWLYVCLTFWAGRLYSAIPLLGGGSLAVGMLLLPATRPYAWVAVLVDPGTLIFLLALPSFVAEFWNRSR